ncbi:hypothetical protein [Chitinophaga varians]|uniref:hypothetical protein n=1 Tax=Chitinophaga varians TaxID=2202339 RepID=UPI00165F595F|nr:hypothetical protein [Chitinophaga varians]MBC9914960.1 hypothetical protein [Chitinophaga varians]
MDKEKDVTERPDPPFSKDDLLGTEGESDFTEEQAEKPATTDDTQQQSPPESDSEKKT